MIAAFALGAFFSFVLFIGLDAISQVPFFSHGTDYYIQLFGIKMHTANMSRGVMDIRDLIYFIALAALFLFFTKIQISKQQKV